MSTGRSGAVPYRDRAEYGLAEVCRSLLSSKTLVHFGKFRFQLLKGTARELTLRMKTRSGDELMLDERDYTMDVDDTTKCYVSHESGIVVEMKDARYLSDYRRGSSQEAQDDCTSAANDTLGLGVVFITT